jgi:HEAT repeat protein
MELFTIVHAFAILFTILSALLVAVILGLHLWKDIRLGREAGFRHATEPMVKAFLAGSARHTEVVAALKKNPSTALHLLLDLSEAAGPKEIEPLRNLFRSFPCLPQMLAGLKHRHEATRLQNAQRLGYFRDESAIADLMKTLDDESPAVRLAAAQSLALLGCSDAAKPILLNPNFVGEMPQDRMVEVLVQFGSGAIEPLLAVLNNPQTPDRTLAIALKASGLLRASRAVPRLIEALQHKVADIRLNAVSALASIGDASVIDPISRHAQDTDTAVRSEVMASLGVLRATDHIPLLVRALHDPAWEVRLSAARALYQMGNIGREALEKVTGHQADPLARNISRQVLQEHGHDLPAEKAQV